MTMTYDPENIFAKILKGAIPCDKVYEDETVLAFRDITPAAPVHVLVVPKAAYVSFDDFSAKADADTLAAFFGAIGRIATELGVVDSGYRLIMNHGAHASQTVPHFHVHLLAGRPLGGLLTDDKRLR